MNFYFFLFLIPFIIFISGCNSQSNQEQSKQSSSTSESSEDVSDFLKRGTGIKDIFQKTLFEHLSKAIADSGVSYALNYCNLHALPLTDSIANLHNVRLQRVSHKPRNQKNSASAEEMLLIESYSAQNEKGEQLQPVVKPVNNSFVYYAPIKIISPLCLNCHGIPEKDIAPENFILINMLYPQDKATGFKMNDLRGLWKISFQKQPL